MSVVTRPDHGEVGHQPMDLENPCVGGWGYEKCPIRPFIRGNFPGDFMKKLSRRQLFYKLLVESARRTIEVEAGNDIRPGEFVVSGPDGKAYSVKRCWAGKALTEAKSGGLVEAEVLAHLGDD